MTTLKFILNIFALLGLLMTTPAGADEYRHDGERYKKQRMNVQVGPRPYYLVNEMSEGKLKKQLQECAERPFYKTDFSISHRGAPLQFPEHTKESYLAAARMGAGIMECDVTFTKDGELVCRHDQCDLHTTTNILATPLAAKCSRPFAAAVPGTDIQASAKCCTSDITLAEFKTLCGKMDAANPNATTVAEYLNGTPNWRTDLYTTCGTLMTHKESIDLFKKLGLKMTPELKTPDPETPIPFDTDGDGIGDFSQTDYAQKMIDEYKQAGVKAKNVYAQSFNGADILYWIANEPRFGKQAVYLEGRYDQIDPNNPADPGVAGNSDNPTLREIADKGVKIIAPPLWVLLTVENGEIVPSKYALAAKAAGLDIIAWSSERSGRIKEEVLDGGNNFYYLSTLDIIRNDGDILTTLDVLAQQVGVIGIFSDWPGTTTYYANCMGLK